MADKHVIIIGGVSVNNTTHDGNPWNFINPAIRRAKALKTSVVLILYTPNYERRVANQKDEHRAVENPKKDPDYFVKKVESLAKEHGFTLHKIKSADELTAQLKAIDSIETIDFFGHSNIDSIFLEYSSIEDSVSKDTWKLADAKHVRPSQFADSAVFASYGCYQGDAGGLAEKLRDQWKIRTIGSRKTTNFEITGPFGGPTFPTSTGGYVEFAKPTPGKPSPPAKPLTYSKTSPPQ